MIDRAEHEYDVFISCHQSDENWVEDWLSPRLEHAGLRVLDRHGFVVGRPRIENIEWAVQASRRTVVVLTPAWLEDEWNNFEALLLRTMDPAARQRKLLPVLLKPCEPPPAIDSLEKVDLTAERLWNKEIRRLTRDIQDTIPVPPPWREHGLRDIAQWKRWLRRYRHEVRLGAVGLLALWLLTSMVLQLPPFQQRRGWQALGFKIEGAWHLVRAGDVLLASTTTEFLGRDSVDTGLWRSTDQGETWQAIAAPLEFQHPSRGSLLAAITAFAEVPAAPQRIYATTTDVGLLRSEDAGEHWTRLESNTLPPELGEIAVASNDANRIFVAGQRAGLFRSPDGGAHWERVDGATNCQKENETSLPATFQVGAMVATGNELYIGSDAGLTSPKPSGGIYASHDGGTCWQRLDHAEERYNYRALAQVPSLGGKLLALTYDTLALKKEDKYQLWLIEPDRGRTHVLWSYGITAHPLYIDAASPSSWYVATSLGHVFRGSLDQPGTWEALPRITACLTFCWPDLAADSAPGPPLLLMNERVFRLGMVPWYRRLWP